MTPSDIKNARQSLCLSTVQVKPLTSDEKHIGVIVSTDSEGNDTRVSAKRWDRKFDGLASDWITISVYRGNSWWQEQELRVEDALRFAALIQHKAGATLAEQGPNEIARITVERDALRTVAFDALELAHGLSFSKSQTVAEWAHRVEQSLRAVLDNPAPTEGSDQ